MIAQEYIETILCFLAVVGTCFIIESTIRLMLTRPGDVEADRIGARLLIYFVLAMLVVMLLDAPYII